MKSRWLCLSLCALASFIVAEASAAEITWLTDYAEAYTAAQEQHKMLLIFFEDEQPTAATKAFNEVTLADEAVQAKLAGLVCLRVPKKCCVDVNGQSQELLHHGSFAPMQDHAGLAIVDLAHEGKDYYRDTVTCLPFARPNYFAPQYYSAKSLKILLDLPAGSLTQRTMVFAVRCHPERPASTQGRADEILMSATASHSAHQASITNQGHHNWDSRFQQLYAKLGGTPPTEVCAQSWPGETLVDACFSAVDSWRHSSGHWSAVSAKQPAYGYDIRRGRDGNWYATGIFGGRKS